MPSPSALLTGDVSDPRTPVVVAARRTPVGTAGGALRTVDVVDLAAPVLRALLADLGSATADGRPGHPDDVRLQVDDVVLGNCMGPGGNPARVAAWLPGLGARRARADRRPAVRQRARRHRRGRPHGARGGFGRRGGPGRGSGEREHRPPAWRTGPTGRRNRTFGRPSPPARSAIPGWARRPRPSLPRPRSPVSARTRTRPGPTPAPARPPVPVGSRPSSCRWPVSTRTSGRDRT